MASLQEDLEKQTQISAMIHNLTSGRMNLSNLPKWRWNSLNTHEVKTVWTNQVVWKMAPIKHVYKNMGSSLIMFSINDIKNRLTPPIPTLFIQIQNWTLSDKSFCPPGIVCLIEPGKANFANFWSFVNVLIATAKVHQLSNPRSKQIIG